MPDSVPPPGFRSERAKRSLAGWIWGLGIPIGIIQLIVPVASVVWLVVIAIAAAFTGPSVQVDRAVSFDDTIWIPRTHDGDHPSGKKGRHWDVVRLDRPADPVVLPPELSTGLAPWLIPDGDRLRVVSGRHRGVVGGEAVTLEEQGDRFHPASRVFCLRGKPAVLIRKDRALDVFTWSSGAWIRQGAAQLALPPSAYPDEMVAVVEGSSLHVFMLDGDDILYGEGTLADGELQDFRKVSASDGGIAAGVVNGSLFLVRVRDEEAGNQVEVLKRVGDRFTAQTKLAVDGADEVQWLTLDGSPQLLVETTLGGVQRLGFDG
ncbi:MAG: hypothetical protein ACOC1F_06015, partial [Myxococcota bacterium]